MGQFRADPAEGATVRFGRNRREVEVCVGADDDQVSRQHGLVVCRNGQWWLSNTGLGPIELPNERWLRPSEAPVPLPTGYTTVFVLGSRSRDHLLELHVSDLDGSQPPPRDFVTTRPTVPWELSERERLVLVALGHRYLRDDPHPQPMTRAQVAELLNDTQHPGKPWDEKSVERVIVKVRKRLTDKRVPYLTREEVGEPVGNALSENLLRELIRSMTLEPKDLALLEPEENDSAAG
jgi:hypothetical protein